ncbi:hypothetical protein CHH58_05230 [Terribacillus saccharophilus]|uniref:nuclear transport factor 2 family protein n=1 Tax=Terribacillus saccharophilus TaxID=361277 RepID=UPI000BA5CC7A|nr:nuclear transport factor 2 family protein [Terribacillus saccharophilus]PAF38828.1 hypothetical protein CHH58_05230 [Terribacillus saccharophilus]
MSDDKEKILAVYQRINEAMVNKDTEMLDNIFNNNHKFVHMNGYQQSKQEWLKQIEKEEMKYFKTMPQKITVTFNGNTAILICIIRLMREFTELETLGV